MDGNEQKLTCWSGWVSLQLPSPRSNSWFNLEKRTFFFLSMRNFLLFFHYFWLIWIFIKFFFFITKYFLRFFRCDSRSIPINTFRIFKLFFYSSFSCHTISLSRLRREMSSSRMVISFLQRRSFIEAKSYKTSFLCSTYEAPSDDG